MNDDFNRAPQTPQSRKPFTPNRYNNPGGYNYNYNQNQGGFNGQQHPRRRTDRFKRETLNSNDKIARQNDIIIRLLKEIRDRLPPPPVSTAVPADAGISSPEQITQEQIAAEQVTPDHVAQETVDAEPKESVPSPDSASEGITEMAVDQSSSESSEEQAV